MDIARRFCRKNGQVTNHDQGDKESGEQPPRYSGIAARESKDNEKSSDDEDETGSIFDEARERLTVLVGPEAMRYNILEKKLCEHSGFLEAERLKRAFVPSLSTAKRRTYSFPSMKPDTFEAYLHWAHHHEVLPLSPLQQVKLYLVAFKLEDLTLQNLIVDSFLRTRKQSRQGFAATVIARLYKQDSSATLLAKMVRDDSFHLSSPSNADQGRRVSETLPKEFFVDMTVQLCKRRNNTSYVTIDITKASKCAYHNHNDKVPKCDSRLKFW